MTCAYHTQMQQKLQNSGIGRESDQKGGNCYKSDKSKRELLMLSPTSQNSNNFITASALSEVGF